MILDFLQEAMVMVEANILMAFDGFYILLNCYCRAIKAVLVLRHDCGMYKQPLPLCRSSSPYARQTGCKRSSASVGKQGVVGSEAISNMLCLHRRVKQKLLEKKRRSRSLS